MTYSEKLRDPRWQKKRLDILSRDNFTCQCCGDTETELNVHHKKYKKGKEPWDYPNNFLETLCKHCHLFITTLEKNIVQFEQVTISKVNLKDRNGYVYVVLHYKNGEIFFSLSVFEYLKDTGVITEIAIMKQDFIESCISIAEQYVTPQEV